MNNIITIIIIILLVTTNINDSESNRKSYCNPKSTGTGDTVVQ